MNNKDFITELSKRTGHTNEETQEMVNSLLKAMGKCFEEGNGVQIQEVGQFDLKKHHERVLVNSSTHQKKLLPPKVTLLFKTLPVFQSQIK